MVTAPDWVLLNDSRSILWRVGVEKRTPSPKSTGRTHRDGARATSADDSGERVRATLTTGPCGTAHRAKGEPGSEIAKCDLNRVRPQCHDRVMVEGSDEQGLELIPLPAIQKRILVVRERHVMLDEDLAELYGVETRRLIEQVKRNIQRFPSDFMFQLSKEEAAALRSQSATSGGRGGRRYAPYVFTEQGVAMLSGVLRSETAVTVNIAIMRSFVELRRAATSYAAIERRLADLERETVDRLGKHDEQLLEIFKALRQLISPPPRPKRRVGFRLPEEDQQ
jgi:ORF6N domain